MKFSRIVTVYNQWDYLHWLMDDRLFTPATEFIIVDDCSPQRPSVELLDRMRAREVKVLSLPLNSGRCIARNTGAHAAQGDYLDFIDGDDLPLPLSADSSWWNADVVHFPFAVHGIGGDMHRSFVRHPLLADPLAPQGFLDPRPAAILWRRETFLQTGGFAAQWETFEDVDLLLRAQPLTRGYASHPKQSYNEQSRLPATEIAYSGARVRRYSRLPLSEPLRASLLEGEYRALWLQTTWALLRHRHDGYLFRSAVGLLWNLVKARLGLLRR